jgi:hypothetical protein
VEQIASEAGISRAAAGGAGTPLEGAHGDTADRAIGPEAAAVPPVGGPVAVVEVLVAVAVVDGADERPGSLKKIEEDR